MKTLLKAWTFLSGKKTAYGVIGIALTGALDALGLLSSEATLGLLGFFGSLASLGVGHKFFKKQLF